MSESRIRPARVAPAVSLMLAMWCAAGSAQTAPPQPAQPPQPPQPPRKLTINEYLVRGNTVLETREIERAVMPFLGPERTMEDVQAAVKALLAAYQAHGYQSVYVDLPEQQVSGGVVILQVSETKVGKVEVVGAKHTSTAVVRARVPALKPGEVPDFNLAQKELTEINRTPKLQVVPLVHQGETPDTMDVQLKVDDKSPWRFSANLTNDHSADTHALRTSVTVGNDNLWQLGHVLSFTFFGAPQDLQQAKVFSGSYALPLGSPDWTFEVSGYTSDSNVLTAGSTNVTGRGHSEGVKLSRTLPVMGAWWHQLSVGIDFKDLDQRVEQVGTTQPVQFVPLHYAPITLGYSGLLQTEKNLLSLGLQALFTTGREFGSGSNANDFDYARYKAESSFFVVKGNFSDTLTIIGGWQLYANVSTQWTDSPLTSGEQFAAGGIYTVRGYLSAEALGDYGAQGTLEVRTPPIPLWKLQEWRLYIFSDGALMRLHKALPEQQATTRIASTGAGSTFHLFSHFDARVDYAHALIVGPNPRKGDNFVDFSVGVSF